MEPTQADDSYNGFSGSGVALCWSTDRSERDVIVLVASEQFLVKLAVAFSRDSVFYSPHFVPPSQRSCERCISGQPIDRHVKRMIPPIIRNDGSRAAPSDRWSVTQNVQQWQDNEPQRRRPRQVDQQRLARPSLTVLRHAAIPADSVNSRSRLDGSSATLAATARVGLIV